MKPMIFPCLRPLSSGDGVDMEPHAGEAQSHACDPLAKRALLLCYVTRQVVVK